MSLGALSALTALAVIAADILLGRALRTFYRHWTPATTEAMRVVKGRTSLPHRLREFLKTELSRHYLYSDHRSVLQPDGGFRQSTLFDPHVGWRWGPSRRIYLHPAEGTRPTHDTGLFTDRFGHIPNHLDVTLDLERKLPNQYRVFVLGGSSVAGPASVCTETGLGIRNAGTIPAETERVLNARAGGRRFQVINLGVHAYRSFHELIYYATEWSHYPHDLVVAIHGYNDAVLSRLDGPTRLWSDTSYTPANVLNLVDWSEEVMRLVRFQQRCSTVRVVAGLAKEILLGSTAAILARFTYREVRHSIDSDAGTIEPKEDVSHPGQTLTPEMREQIDAFARRLVANDLRLAAAAAAEGRRFISIVQPMLVTKRHPTPEEAPYIRHAEHYRAFQGAARACYRNRTADFSALDAETLDWSDLLDDSRERLFSDIIHYSDLGIRVIAERLADVIRAAADENEAV